MLELSRYWIFTLQALTGSGFCMVKYSVKPWPTLPSAKYHVGCTGPGGRLGRGVPVGVGDGVVVGDGMLVAVVVGDSVLVAVVAGVSVFGEACAPWCGLRSVQASTRLPTKDNVARPTRTINPTLKPVDRDIPQKLFVFITILSTPLY